MSTETWIALTSGSLPFALGAQPLQLTMMTHSFPHYCYSLLIMVTQGLLSNRAVNLPVNWAPFHHNPLLASMWQEMLTDCSPN